MTEPEPAEEEVAAGGGVLGFNAFPGLLVFLLLNLFSGDPAYYRAVAAIWRDSAWGKLTILCAASMVVAWAVAFGVVLGSIGLGIYFTYFS